MSERAPEEPGNVDWGRDHGRECAPVLRPPGHHAGVLAPGLHDAEPAPEPPPPANIGTQGSAPPARALMELFNSLWVILVEVCLLFIRMGRIGVGPVVRMAAVRTRVHSASQMFSASARRRGALPARLWGHVRPPLRGVPAVRRGPATFFASL